MTAGRNGEVFIDEFHQTMASRERRPFGPSVGVSVFRADGTVGLFSQVSATQTSTGADVVFGTLSDGSLWEYTNGGWTELLSGGVASTATPL